MTQKDSDKNIFEKARDAMSTRDEQEALAAAKKRIQDLESNSGQVALKLAAAEKRATETGQKLADSEKKVTQLTNDLSKAQSELAAMRAELITAKRNLTSTEQRLASTTAELQKHISADQAEKIAQVAAEQARAQVMAEHTVKQDETLSHIAQKYYGSAAETYWRLIYEANRTVIGDNPGRIRPGMELKIPVLPEELKRK